MTSLTLMMLVANDVNVNVNSREVRIFAKPEYRKAQWLNDRQQVKVNDRQSDIFANFKEWKEPIQFKLLNYTHPWRDVVNFAAHFFVFLFFLCSCCRTRTSTRVLPTGFQAPQRQDINHHISKRGTLDHPPRGGKVPYRFSAFWLRSVTFVFQPPVRLLGTW